MGHHHYTRGGMARLSWLGSLVT